jgi:hypothetical protein
MKDTMIGVDLAKSIFQVHGALMSGKEQFSKKADTASVLEVHGRSFASCGSDGGLRQCPFLGVGDDQDRP